LAAHPGLADPQQRYANRQAGALVGVAVMGTLIHGLPDWPTRLAAVFAISAAGYSALLATRRLRRPA